MLASFLYLSQYRFIKVIGGILLFRIIFQILDLEVIHAINNNIGVFYEYTELSLPSSLDNWRVLSC